MKDMDKMTRRLALLDGIDLSPADLQWIAGEVEDLERVVAELEEFGQGTPWMAMQVQPADKKV